ncbi:hypothetical protein [Clostridium sp. LP20]|uniref:hypothetical protein n=1 Tax=Clostridium sp. LP20 TaxID=3418665 RepID=UPI003EE7107C
MQDEYIDKKLSKRTITSAIIIYTMIPFFMIFEERKPKARELIIISMLSSIAVVGRVAFLYFHNLSQL